MTLSRSNPSPLLIVALMAILVLFGVTHFAMNVPQVYPGHANNRHGVDADRARTCSDRPDMVLFNPELNRKAYICVLDGDEIGAHFLDADGNEITAYIINKVKDLTRAVEILAKTGFFPVQ